MTYLVYENKKIAIDNPGKNLIITEDSYLNDIIGIIKKWNNQDQDFELFTSGSTGNPRLIKFNRKQLEISALQTAEFFKLLRNDFILCCLPVSHVAGFMMIIRCLVNGMNIIAGKPSANPLKNFKTDYKPDFSAFVPIQLVNIIEECPEKLDILNNMKGIMVGGGKVTERLLKQINQISSPVYETFGMTETLTHVGLKRINGKNPDKYFVPLPGIKIGIDDKGYMSVKSPVTLDKELITNDIIKLNEDNTFEWIGRSDNIVNSGGYKIQIEKTEERAANILEAQGLRNSFFFTGIKDEKMGELLVMVIEEKIQNKLDEHKIIELLKSGLNLYEVPRKIYFIPGFILTGLGKINRLETMKIIDI